MHTRLPDSERVTSARSLSVPASATAGAAVQQLKHGPRCGPDLPVCLGERLVGIVPVELLLSAEDEAPVAALMTVPGAVASPDDDQERLALRAAQTGSRSVAVVDDQGRFLRLVG